MISASSGQRATFTPAMTDYPTRAATVLRRIEQLAAISEEPSGVTRTFGTPAFVQGRALVQSWFETAGLHTRVDAVGNVRGRRVSAVPGAKTFVIGSHIDTVVNAGKYDGPLGVLLGLDLLEHLGARELPFHLELIAFSDEEGVRFHTTYLGSKVVAGSFDPALLTKADANGVTLAQALTEMEAESPNSPIPSSRRFSDDAIAPTDFLGYFEAHIEQGPVLWERPLPVGVVTAIAGQRRAELTWRGMAGHAGTVPMLMRQDALAAAAEFVLATEALARADAHGLVATVGKLTVTGAASNVIPGEVVGTLDLRSPDETRLAAAYDALRATADAIADARGVGLEWNLVQAGAPVACDPALNDLLDRAIADAGHPVVALVSGAGHDAVPISAVAPVAMLFIRCFKGISHNPLEHVEPADLSAALEVSDRFLAHLAARYSPTA